MGVIARGFFLDGQTQVGCAGSPAQVLLQRMSDLEGRALALRWAETILPAIGTVPMHQLPWPLCEQPSRPKEAREPLPGRPVDTESEPPLLGTESLDKVA